MAERSFSHAIAEGDGISVIAAVEDADAARAAQEQRAEALVVTGDPAAVPDGSSLPILWRADVPLEHAASAADAYLLVLDVLAAVPAGKLAIADLRLTTLEEVQELERAGCDGVIVHSPDVSPLTGA